MVQALLIQYQNILLMRWELFNDEILEMLLIPEYLNSSCFEDASVLSIQAAVERSRFYERFNVTSTE